jgi:hypothetical protein
MSLLGTGALVIWHDIVSEHRAEYRDWHGKEHLPERLGIPGILRGRRYEAVEGGPEFLTLYEAAALEDITGEGYVRRRGNLTPWSRKMLSHFSNHHRAVAEVVCSAGTSSGGLCATWRFRAPEEAVSGGLENLMTAVHRVVVLPDVAGVHLLRADMTASTADFAERAAQGLSTEVPSWALLVEWWGDAASFRAWCKSEIGGLAGDLSRYDCAFGMYRVANTLCRSDSVHPSQHHNG